MVGCSLSIGVSCVFTVRREAILRKMGNQNLNSDWLGFRIVLKDARFPVFSGNKLKKEGIVTMNMSQPPDESQYTETTKEISGVGGESVLENHHKFWVSGSESRTDRNDSSEVIDNGGDNNGSYGNGGAGEGGSGSDSGDDNGDKEEDELGSIMKYDEIMRETEARGVTLPSDMLEAAKSVGIRKVLLLRYLDLQGSVWPLGFAVKSFSMIRNRLLADPSFLFKILSEIITDSTCATVAEVQKRGKKFWSEFELYVADLLVGSVLNVALVGMLAPCVRIGKPSVSKGVLGRMQQVYASLPGSVFEAERPGCRFSVQQRIGTYFFKGIMYGAVGFGCAIFGQGIANLIMTAKRKIRKSEEDIPVPPLLKSAALWGVFLAISLNTRYQIINGLERLVEASPIAEKVPPVAMAFTVGVRFANHVYGSMQFVDWARWTGVQ